MSNYKCQQCAYTNWINTNASPKGRPLQDWFCKKCQYKLFSVSFVKPCDPDTKPIQCQLCSKSILVSLTPTAVGGRFNLACPECSSSVLALKVEGTLQSEKNWKKSHTFTKPLKAKFK